MVPMADNLNHSSVEVTNEMINLKYHIQGHKNENYFSIEKFFNDYSAIFKHLKTPDELMEKNNLNITGRFNREIFKMNCSSLSVCNQRA